MMFQAYGTMNGQLLLRWILRFSDVWETHFCPCVSTNLWSILSLMRMKHQMRCSCTNRTVLNAPWLVHFFLKRRCNFVLCQAKFVIWSGCSQSFLRIIWIYSTFLRKWATMSKQKGSSNSSVFVTTPKVGGTGLNLTAANHEVITQKFWVLNEQWQAFAWVVWLGRNRVPYTWLLNTGSKGYDNTVSDLHQLSGMAQMRVLHGPMNRLNITTTMIYQILECRPDHAKQLTEHGDFVVSHGEDERSLSEWWNQGMPL